MNEQDILNELGDAEFRPYCELCEAVDALIVYFKGDADYAQRLTDDITLYRSLDTNEVVGCRIKGIKGILGANGAAIAARLDAVQRAAKTAVLAHGSDTEKEAIAALGKLLAEGGGV